MIILDTNVVSEALRTGRDKTVVSWLDQQVAETLYLTSITVSELVLGAEYLPTGKRKDNLRSALRILVEEIYKDRILPFNNDSAMVYGRIVAAARNRGKTISVGDGQIGAIAHVFGFSIASRNTHPFVALGLKVINPWHVLS